VSFAEGGGIRTEMLGWAPADIRCGTNGRHCYEDGRRPEALPCHALVAKERKRQKGCGQKGRTRRSAEKPLRRGRVTPAPGRVFRWGRRC
jgi:hypothetical protein